MNMIETVQLVYSILDINVWKQYATEQPFITTIIKVFLSASDESGIVGEH